MSVDTLLKISEKLRNFCNFVGKVGSFAILPLVFFTMWDVVIRKLGGGQIWLTENIGSMFESTKIQEWEWHWHTALFALVLGYGYVNNRHVRVDLLREHLKFKTQAWIELLGVTFFMIPYCVIVGYYAGEFAWGAFVTNEISPSTVGLEHRWIIKTVLASGILIAGVAGISVWLQVLAVLLSPEDKRFELMVLEWPEEQERKRRVAIGTKKKKATSS